MLSQTEKTGFNVDIKEVACTSNVLRKNGKTTSKGGNPNLEKKGAETGSKINHKKRRSDENQQS